MTTAAHGELKHTSWARSSFPSSDTTTRRTGYFERAIDASVRRSSSGRSRVQMQMATEPSLEGDAYRNDLSLGSLLWVSSGMCRLQPLGRLASLPESVAVTFPAGAPSIATFDSFQIVTLMASPRLCGR